MPVSTRDLRDAPWVLWSGEPPAAGFPGLIEAVLAQAGGHGRTLRNLAEAWMQHLDPVRPEMLAVGRRIGHLVEVSPDPRLEAWRKALRPLRLFDGGDGPRYLAHALLRDVDRPVEEILKSVGFDDPIRAVGGYMRMTQRALLDLLPANLHERLSVAAPLLDRALGVLTCNGKLRFPDERGPMANGLLAAWLGGREPDAALKERIQRFLLDHLGDPRLRPDRWIAVSVAGQALMRRWLAAASLETFFELIERHAWDQQWRYRKAFWTACLRKGGITDAWLALGSRVHADARAVRSLGGAYARLRGGGGDQAVLLMRVGALVLTEWSHAGKLRAWPNDWKNAPRLGRSEYTRDDTIGAGLPFPDHTDKEGLPHYHPEGGWWQRRAAALLARHGGPLLREADWRP